MVASAIGTAASAYLVKPVLDKIFIQKDVAMLQILPPLVILMYFLKGFGKFIQIYYTELIGQDIIKKLREEMLESLLNMQMRFFIESSSGKLISRLTNDINRIKNVVSNMIPDLFRESLTIIALTFVVIYQSPKLALYFLFIMPLALYPLSRLAKRMKQISKKSQESIGELTAHLSEIFNNIELIKAEAKEEEELNRFKRHNKAFFEITLKQVRTSELVSPLMEVLGAVIVALVIYVGGMEVIKGHMSTGSFFSFMTALFMLYGPIKNVSKLYNKLQDATAAAERIFEFIDLKPSIRSGKKTFKDANKLCFEKVSLSYGQKLALKDISFCTQKGQITALVGQSGSGKSSLINLLVRFFDPTEGKITIDGVDIKAFDLKSLRQRVALVSQRVYLFEASIAQNIGGEEFDEKRVIEALKMAKAWDFVAKLPQKIHTPLAEAGANLSGGQRQRLAIARALYKDAKILIFDEATSALDKETEMDILQTIKSIADDKIILFISHNPQATRFADQIIMLHQGTLLCKGKLRELLKSCSQFKRIFEIGYN